jgi:hypothetical protein
MVTGSSAWVAAAAADADARRRHLHRSLQRRRHRVGCARAAHRRVVLLLLLVLLLQAQRRRCCSCGSRRLCLLLLVVAQGGGPSAAQGIKQLRRSLEAGLFAAFLALPNLQHLRRETTRRRAEEVAAWCRLIIRRQLDSQVRPSKG